MKKFLIFLSLLIFFTCKKKEEPMQVIKEKLEVTNYFIDEDLKLILSNMDVSLVEIETSLEEFILDKTYTLTESVSNLEFGRSYLVENNNETYQLFFSELPILNISSNNTIPDEPKVAAQAELFTPNATDQQSFTMGIETRGGWSQTFPKKSYGIEIWEDESGTTNKDLSFLGMREDDDWILDAMYNDPLRMRNLISHRIWRLMHTPYYASLEPEARSTVSSEYVEIFINQKYQGIFALSERIDRKLLKLKKYNGEIRGELYKGISWINALFTSIVDYDNNSIYWEGFQMEYPTDDEITDWSKLYAFVDFVVNSSDEEFKDEISNKIYTSNFIDYFIFLNLTRATDNTGKNIYLAKYNSNQPYFYIPWDLDGTWGTQYEGNRENITDDILTNGLYARLFELDPDEFNNAVSSRWNELKTNQLSQENILSLFQNEKELLKKNGVFDRENLVWDFEYLEDDYIYMSNWINERWNYLDVFFQ